jgi:simple sugar transport system permease protein
MLQNKKTENTIAKEPLIRIAKRENASSIYRFSVRFIACVISFLIILIFINSVTDMSSGKILKVMFKGAFGVKYSVISLFKNMMLLLCVGLALAPAYKMRFWNIGAQGQILAGGLLATVFMVYFDDAMSNSSLIFLMWLSAVVAGGIWALIPALFKVKLNANETLFTLMMNYIAIQLVGCCTDIWRGQNSAFGIINSETNKGYLSAIGDNPYGLIYVFVIILTFIMFIYMRNTKHGYEISVVGESLNTARYAGINTKKVILRTLFISGAICGFVGFMYVSGVDHTISESTSGSYGFTAIIVAWAAKFNPFGMAAISFLIAFLEKGSSAIVDTSSNLNSYTAYIVVGIFLIVLIGSEFFINYKIVFNSRITEFNRKNKEKVLSKMPKTVMFFKKLHDKFIVLNIKIEFFAKKILGRISGLFDKFCTGMSFAVKKFFGAVFGKIKFLFQKIKKAKPDGTKGGTDNE